MIHITLPWPVSINALYRSVVKGKGKKAYSTSILSKRGRQYFKDAGLAILCSGSRPKRPIEAPVRLDIGLYPPTLRGYDCDNMVKCVQDALTHCNVWIDDSQVHILRVEKGPKFPGGKAEITITILPVDKTE